jgi:alpha,alpha-trehalase
VEARGDVLWFNPAIPQELQALEFQIHYRGHRVQVRLTPEVLRVSALPSEEAPIQVGFRDEVAELRPAGTLEWSLTA